MENLMGKMKILIGEEEIQNKISELAKEIDQEYCDTELVVISILKGSLFFAVDLTRKMKTPIIFETLHAHSYEGTESTGNVSILDDITFPIAGKDVLIVEDIIDTGYTLDKIKKHLLSKKPNSLKIATLIDKKARRQIDVSVDYVGFDIPNKFIFGYGLDYDEKYRNLPYIGYIE